MSTKREYLLQKGRQLQALTADVDAMGGGTASNPKSASGKQARELSKVRDLCPNGTDDDVLLALLARAHGDQAKIEQAISELWENHRGGGADEWATVEKKTKKKTETSSFSASRRGGRTDRSDRPAYNKANASPQPEDAPTDGGDATDDRVSRAGGRGTAGVRGRGARGGVRGRGVSGRGVPRTGPADTTTTGEPDETTDDVPADKAPTKSSSGSATTTNNQKRKDHHASGKQTETQQPAVVAAPPPPPVIPGLTGAWTKKPNLAGLIQPTKPVEAPKPVEKPTEKAGEKPTAAAASPATVAATTTPSTQKQPTPASPAAKPTAPVASPKATPASPAVKVPASPVAAAAVAKPTAAASPKKTATPKKAAASPKPVEKVASPKADASKKLESPSISAWGSLDVSTTTIGDWASTSTTATTEKKTVHTPNAWARGSPLVTSETNTSAPATPVSPKEIPVARSPHSAGSATSPKYLKLGRWESSVAANLSLQFGSFSLNGVEHVESTSPRGWGSTSTSTSTKTTTKTSENTSAWGTQPTAASPKKKAAPLSPARATESEDRKTTASVPPGLAVESGRVTPKSAQSPRGFAPSAPSPASLPKPDEVKRNTPTRAQGGHFQGAAQTQSSSKIGSGSNYAADFNNAKSSTIYQSTYGQYAMGLGAAGNQAQLNASNTPKGAAARHAASAPAVQSPTHGAQQAQAAQFQQQAQPTQQQQQKPTQQQAQQTQAQQQQHQGQPGQHAHQNMPGHHQGPPGYHPHYAPPPPPGMAMAYNPYNYANYYQGYGYYQNPQYQYSPRTQYPPRGSVPYGVEGPMPGFSNPPNVPVGYQDQHLLHQHDYPGAIPQGFGEISGAYGLQQPGHHHHSHAQGGPQSHGKGSNQSGTQQPRSGSGAQGYQGGAAANARDHAAAGPAANPAAGGAASAASYGQQHYGWASYGAQPMGGWGHMMPQGYQQQNPSQHQQHQASHQGSHQQSYRQYGSNNAQGGNAGASETGSGSGAHGHGAWSS